MGLRSKLSLALIMLALVPLVIVTIALVRVNLRSLEDSAKNYRLAVAHNATNAVRSTLEHARSELRSIQRVLLQGGLTLPERIRLIRAVLSGTEIIDAAAIFNRKGLLAQIFHEKGKALLIEPPKHLEERITKRALKATISFQRVRKGKKGELHLPFLIPVHLKNKKLFGYLWTSISMRHLHKRFAKMSALRFERRKDRIFLLDNDSRIISHGISRFRGEKAHADIVQATHFVRQGIGYTLSYTRGNQKFMAALEPLTELGWIVVTEDTLAKVFATVRATWIRASIVGLIFCVLALLLGFWMGERLAAPILSVSNAANRVAGGDFGVRVKVSSRDEVGEMASSFNRMASDLETYEAQLVEETRIRTDLGRYLNNDLVEDIVHKKAPLKLGGERRQVTVIFADVVAFTPLTEKHDPEQIVAILNELFTFSTEIIFRHGGIIDKFLGDCVMAVFGAPYAHEDDVHRAVRAAEEMLRWLEVGNSRWKKELGVSLEMAIGINTGEVVVGNIGSEKRMEYTVIGDSVNIAARLETLARPGQILMTRAVADCVEDEFDCESLGEYKMPDGKRSLELFTLSD